MTIYDEISIIANNLANQGKKPTVALVKTKLSQPAPLPIIISTLKGWQHDPDFISLDKNKVQEDKIEPVHNKENNLKEIEAAVTKATAPLRNDIAELKAIIEQLSKKIG